MVPVPSSTASDRLPGLDVPFSNLIRTLWQEQGCDEEWYISKYSDAPRDHPIRAAFRCLGPPPRTPRALAELAGAHFSSTSLVRSGESGAQGSRISLQALPSHSSPELTSQYSASLRRMWERGIDDEYFTNRYPTWPFNDPARAFIRSLGPPPAPRPEVGGDQTPSTSSEARIHNHAEISQRPPPTPPPDNFPGLNAEQSRAVRVRWREGFGDEWLANRHPPLQPDHPARVAIRSLGPPILVTSPFPGLTEHESFLTRWMWTNGYDEASLIHQQPTLPMDHPLRTARRSLGPPPIYWGQAPVRSERNGQTYSIFQVGNGQSGPATPQTPRSRPPIQNRPTATARGQIPQANLQSNSASAQPGQHVTFTNGSYGDNFTPIVMRDVHVPVHVNSAGSSQASDVRSANGRRSRDRHTLDKTRDVTTNTNIYNAPVHNHYCGHDSSQDTHRAFGGNKSSKNSQGKTHSSNSDDSDTPPTTLSSGESSSPSSATFGVTDATQSSHTEPPSSADSGEVCISTCERQSGSSKNEKSLDQSLCEPPFEKFLTFHSFEKLLNPYIPKKPLSYHVRALTLPDPSICAPQTRLTRSTGEQGALGKRKHNDEDAEKSREIVDSDLLQRTDSDVQNDSNFGAAIEVLALSKSLPSTTRAPPAKRRARLPKKTNSKSLASAGAATTSRTPKRRGRPPKYIITENNSMTAANISVSNTPLVSLRGGSGGPRTPPAERLFTLPPTPSLPAIAPLDYNGILDIATQGASSSLSYTLSIPPFIHRCLMCTLPMTVFPMNSFDPVDSYSKYGFEALAPPQTPTLLTAKLTF
ncbi:hypothetical protein G7Y89_g15389 [Cudoniella acicularis]|uniref:Uncharacterized protein n=1 Tax=Cudoniella acicularis TaxID=354080 RepID=A0A8H4QP05_9HELO|nr:hypothetical protein G7Y89_g15389 [Cudoniella acicularis]